MEAALLAANGWLEAIGIADWARGGATVYPWANVVHVLGAIMLVGGIGIVDLRTVGLWKSLPLAVLSRALTPVAMAGLILQASSGVILFAADGRTLAASTVFHAKLVLVTAALLNAVLFRLSLRTDSDVASAAERASAGLSLVLWLAIAVLGRLIAYY